MSILAPSRVPRYAAIAAASRAVLTHEAPALNPQTEAAYTRALGALADNEARASGIRLGERAAAEVLAKHSDDIDPMSRIDRSRLPACTFRRLSPWAMRWHNTIPGF